MGIQNIIGGAAIIELYFNTEERICLRNFELKDNTLILHLLDQKYTLKQLQAAEMYIKGNGISFKIDTKERLILEGHNSLLRCIATGLTFTKVDQREYKRIRYNAPIVLTTEEATIPGVITNISPGGVGITTSELFNGASHISAKFTINDYSFTMPLELVTISYSDMGARIGFKFLSTDTYTTNRLNRCLTNLMIQQSKVHNQNHCY